MNSQNEDKVLVKWMAFLMGGLVVVALALLISSMMIASAVAASSPFEAIEERLRPVGQVVVTAPAGDETAEPEEQQPAAEEDDEVADAEPASEETARVEEDTPEATEDTAGVEEDTPSATEAAVEQPTETGEAAVTVNGVQIPAGVDAAAGQSVYAEACSVCHAQGIAGAPVLGDAATWNERLAKGWDTLAHNALNGIGAMPPKGGRLDLSDEQILSGVAYMIQQVR